MYHLILILLLSEVLFGCFGDPHTKNLYEHLVSGYNSLIRPSRNSSDSVVVKFRVQLSQLIDVHEKTQIMTSNVWLFHEWYDYKLVWDPNDYGGVDQIYIPSQAIWVPDIVLHNNADGNYRAIVMTKATVHSNGTVIWTPPATFRSMCPIDVQWFPFDRQTCELKFGSWSYDRMEMNLLHGHISSVEDLLPDKLHLGKKSVVRKAMDLSEFYPSTEWDVMGTPGKG